MERENYFFDIDEKAGGNKVFVLIIYDITDNRKRIKFAKFLQGYGFRVQKSAFEAVITKKKYGELLKAIPSFIAEKENDSIKVYKIIGKGQVTSFGKTDENTVEDVIVI